MRVREPLALRLSVPESPLRFEGLRHLGPSLRGGMRGGSSAASALGGHLLLALIATGLTAALREGAPWSHPEPWIVAPAGVAFASSTMLGLTVALAIIALTRLTVRRFSWAQDLYDELRPLARDLDDGRIFAVAALAALGEEVFFRGLLVPVLGVIPAALLFGLAHQMKMRGPTRWVWTFWASVVGLLLGGLFALTGSLVGPVLAHAVINAANLVYLRAEVPETPPVRS